MQFTVSAQGVITAAAFVSAVIVLLKQYNKGYDMIKHQKEQDNKIRQIDEGQTVMIKALLGILDGQIEQGCNGKTHAARDELQEYLLQKGNFHE